MHVIQVSNRRTYILQQWLKRCYVCVYVINEILFIFHAQCVYPYYIVIRGKKCVNYEYHIE